MPRIDEKAILKELARREQHQTAVAKKRAARGGAPEADYPFLKDLFDKQREFIFDPSDHKTLLCSRRAGKSYTAVAYLLKEAFDNPGVTCVYIATTRIQAKRIMEKELTNFNNRYRLGAKYNKMELVVSLPNGSTILLTGANDTSDVDRLRGGKYAIVVVDECASYGPFFENLIEEVIEPALLDLDGTLCLLGTPGPAAMGFFYEATTKGTTGAPAVSKEDAKAGDDDVSEGGDILWRNFAWTVLDNVALRRTRDIPKWLADKRKRKGWTEDHPIYRREWLGQWVKSNDELVYHGFDPDRNIYRQLPPLNKNDKWRYVIGVDIGFNDLFTICAMAFSASSPNVYVVETFAAGQLIPEKMAARLADFIDRYNPVKVVADAGALGKAIVEEFNQRYQLAIKPAEKSGKAAYIDLLNGDLISGRLQLPADSLAIAEMRELQWDAKSNRTKEDASYKNDNCFPAGTLITTQRGEVPIEQIRADDKALTRHGFFPVVDRAFTGRKSLLRLTLEDGTVVSATGNHPFLTAEGWKRLDALHQDDIVYAWREPQDSDISRENRATAQYGSEPTAPFRRDITSITKTETRITTPLRTWSVCPQKSIVANTWTTRPAGLSREKASKKLFSRHLPGTVRQKERHGTISTEKPLGAIADSSLAYVSCVEASLKHVPAALPFVLPNALQNSGATAVSMTSPTLAWSATRVSNEINTQPRVVVPIRVLRLETIDSAPQDVYNITVATAHEYFANGVLVSNCDAMLYAYRECKHWLPNQDDDISSLDRPDYSTDPFDRLVAAGPGPTPANTPWWEQPADQGGFRARQHTDLLSSLGDGNFTESSPVDDEWLS